MRKLSAVSWLSRSCRTLISFLIALALVFSAFAVLKIASRAKQTRVDEFTTGSIQKSSAVRKSETKGRMVSYVDPTVSQPPPRQVQSNATVQGAVPLPRPRPKLK
jgi:hypothetical protein